jgi:thiol-disulfide isomerase/thioredoxin
MPDQPKRPSRSRIGVGAGVAVAVAIGVAIYAGLDGQGNPANAACKAASQKAATLEPFATGEVAAFRVASSPASMAELSFKRPDGSAVTMADFAGRTVLLNLWATWCVPCRAEMPALDRLEAAAGSDSFTVVPVSLDTGTPDKPRQFLEDTGIRSLGLYVDPELGLMDAMRRMGLSRGLPTTVLVDGKGCQLGVMEGPAEWDSPDARALIEAALKE